MSAELESACEELGIPNELASHKKPSGTRTPFDMKFAVEYYHTLPAIAMVYPEDSTLGKLFREWKNDPMNVIEA